mgnify:CR=1 FL=1
MTTQRQRDRELTAAVDLCAAQLRKIQRLQKRVSSLERQLENRSAAGHLVDETSMIIEAV